MSEELFARLYLDEDVDVLVKHLIAARGFDVLTTPGGWARPMPISWRSPLSRHA